MILGEQASNWAAEDGKPLHLILGMLNTKDPTEFAKSLLPKVASAQAITIPDQPLSLTSDQLSSALNIPSTDTLEDAVKKIAASEANPARILITGSLYLMGYILTENT